MTDAAATDPSRGVLVVRGGRGDGFTHLLLRGPGLRLGDDTVLPAIEDQQRLTAVVARLVSAPEPDDVDTLGALGIGFVYVPAPADVAADRQLGQPQRSHPGSAIRPGSRAWQVETEARAVPVTPTSTLRPWLLAGQGAAVLLVAVLAAPTRRVAR